MINQEIIQQQTRRIANLEKFNRELLEDKEMTTVNCKFKAVAVKLVRAGGQSITQTARNLDLTELS